MGFQAEKKLVRELFEQLIGSNELTIEKIFENFVSDDYIFKGTQNQRVSPCLKHIINRFKLFNRECFGATICVAIIVFE